MFPQFASTELNHLLRLELAEGRYGGPEEALVAGLKILRESRESRLQFADRVAALHDGRAIELENDTALGEFLDAIDAEVDAECGKAQSPNS